MAQGLAANAGGALQRLTCMPVRTVTTSMKTKNETEKHTFRTSFTGVGPHFLLHDAASWMNSEGYSSHTCPARLGFDERFQRLWDFYLGWCAGAFREHYIGAVQLVFAKQPVRERVVGEHAVPSASSLSV
jgi:hypothetical protein